MEVTHSLHHLRPDPSRLVARPFIPGSENFVGVVDRLDQIASRVLEIPPEIQEGIIEELIARHGQGFADLKGSWRANFTMAADRSSVVAAIRDTDNQLLLGAYLTQAYAYEAAALTNPSIVCHGAEKEGQQPFVMSARAIGEGHISSIVFLTGTVSSDGEVSVTPRHPHAESGARTAPTYSREAFTEKLTELGFMSRAASAILEQLPDSFDTSQLESALRLVHERDLDHVDAELATKRIHWLAASNYDLKFDPEKPISTHLISPAGPTESRGMEDARFVRFSNDDGDITYYATYTAFDGTATLSQLIETRDFHSFRMATMTGPALHHKGMALFPRKIDGDYVALSRHDHEKSFVLRSDGLRRWSNAEVVFGPEYEWEAVQTGNCGSPIETEAGWLVITHGVGPMRRYTLAAVLLDRDEPTKVLGRLRQPLVEPSQDERYGYVPDVVYSCGSLVHKDNLVIPYGYADVGIGFAVTSVKDLLAEME